MLEAAKFMPQYCSSERFCLFVPSDNESSSAGLIRAMIVARLSISYFSYLSILLSVFRSLLTCCMSVQRSLRIFSSALQFTSFIG